MDTTRTFHADSESELWQQVAADIARQPDMYDYSADLHQQDFRVRLELDIDLGGGFEGGYELTTLTASVPAHMAFHFALHEQDWVHEVGKLLGLQDVEVGDPALDAAFIITTNQPDTLRQLLADPEVRATLLRYPDARLALAPASHAPDAPVQLTFTAERAITEPAQLQEIYHMLLVLQQQLVATPGSM
ncbi:hypothetical protein [Hymenobacter metallilatus]|uniref:DUF3137 domain-containing protein n=1 Tax=Hymenobacter metallilatus TaxID=2493666 RepID=A0A3R9M5H2_9BACT|nr:hypothetical protein [Hymenobacter metallilatus]RSK32441.1 hypothetical protein EI290_11970 [Hymenobacter metallilatus]